MFSPGTSALHNSISGLGNGLIKSQKTTVTDPYSTTLPSVAKAKAEMEDPSYYGGQLDGAVVTATRSNPTSGMSSLIQQMKDYTQQIHDMDIPDGTQSGGTQSEGYQSDPVGNAFNFD